MRFGSSFPRIRHVVLGLVVAVLDVGSPWPVCRADPDPTVNLTEEERAWLNQHDVVRHVPIPDYAPVESYGSGGRPVGIAPDYLSLVAERLGVTVETVDAPDWESALDSVRQGRADLIAAIQKTLARSEYLAFTGPYLSVSDVILVRTQVERLVGLFREEAAQNRTERGAASRRISGNDPRPGRRPRRLRAHSEQPAKQRHQVFGGGRHRHRAGGRGGDAFVVEVEDTGVGIVPDFAPKLYDAFEQESVGTDREYEGVGLGLALTRKLTELMGGTIAVASEKGAGTRFTVRLPQGQPDVPARMAPDEPEAEWQSNGT